MSLITHIRQQLADEEKQAGESQCFIGHEFRNKDLRKKLERALSSLPGTKLQPYFADSEVTGGFLLEKICKKILATRATIVDLSTANPNVYFELGLAIGLNKPIFVVLKQQSVVPPVLESFVKLHFTSYTELEEHLVSQVPSWLEQSIEYHLRYNSHCHFVNVRCPDRQRITPKRRYLLIDHLKVTDEATTPSAYDRDLQQELLSALARFHFEPTSLHKIPLESNFRLCDYCRSLRDSSFAFCHLTRQSSLDVYFLLGLATGLDIPSLLIVQKERDDGVLKPFEIPSMLKGLDLFEYKHYHEIGERLGDEVESFLNAKKYQPIAGRVLTFPEAWRREGEHEDQTEREPSDTPEIEAQTALQQRLLEIKSMSDTQEQLRALIKLSQELADQGDAAGLREIFFLARSFMHTAQQAEALVVIVEAFVRVRDTEGIRRVVEMVLGEERDEVRDPVLGAIVLAYERLGEPDKADEVASLRTKQVHLTSPTKDEVHDPVLGLESDVYAYEKPVERESAKEATPLQVGKVRLTSPTLVLMAGLPGAGKTALAKALGHELGWTVIERDEDVEELLKQGLDDDLAARTAYDLTFAKARTALVKQKSSVILDTAALHQFILDTAIEIVNSAEDARLKVILCVADRDLRNQRLRSKTKFFTSIHVDPATIADYLQYFKHLPQDKLILYTNKPLAQGLLEAKDYVMT